MNIPRPETILLDQPYFRYFGFWEALFGVALLFNGTHPGGLARAINDIPPYGDKVYFHLWVGGACVLGGIILILFYESLKVKYGTSLFLLTAPLLFPIVGFFIAGIEIGSLAGAVMASKWYHDMLLVFRRGAYVTPRP